MTKQSEDKPFERNKDANIFQRLHAVMMEVDYVQKTHEISFGNNSYKVVTHDAVTAKVRPIMVKHGVIYVPHNLAVEQDGNRTAVRLDIVFINIDRPDDRVAVPTIGYGIDSGDKGPGKAVSYAVKYALLKALGLETGEDADLDGGAEHKEGEKSPPGISKVRIEVNEAVRELYACGDEDTLTAFLSQPSTKRLAVKVCHEYPTLWIGPENSGLKGAIEGAAVQVGASAFVVGYIRSVENVNIKKAA